MSRQQRDMVLVEQDGEALIRRLREYRPPDTPRWIGAGQT
jgi:hypothetical protein